MRIMVRNKISNNSETKRPPKKKIAKNEITIVNTTSKFKNKSKKNKNSYKQIDKSITNLHIDESIDFVIHSSLFEKTDENNLSTVINNSLAVKNVSPNKNCNEGKTDIKHIESLVTLNNSQPNEYSMNSSFNNSIPVIDLNDTIDSKCEMKDNFSIDLTAFDFGIDFENIRESLNYFQDNNEKCNIFEQCNIYDRIFEEKKMFNSEIDELRHEKVSLLTPPNSEINYDLSNSNFKNEFNSSTLNSSNSKTLISSFSSQFPIVCLEKNQNINLLKNSTVSNLGKKQNSTRYNTRQLNSNKCILEENIKNKSPEVKKVDMNDSNDCIQTLTEDNMNGTLPMSDITSLEMLQLLCKENNETNVKIKIPIDKIKAAYKNSKLNKNFCKDINPISYDNKTDNCFGNKNVSSNKINENLHYDSMINIFQQKTAASKNDTSAIALELSPFLNFKDSLDTDKTNVVNKDMENMFYATKQRNKKINQLKPHRKDYSDFKTNELHTDHNIRKIIDKKNEHIKNGLKRENLINTMAKKVDKMVDPQKLTNKKTCLKHNVISPVYKNVVENTHKVRKIKLVKSKIQKHNKEKKHICNIFNYILRKVTSFDSLFEGKCIVSECDMLNNLNDYQYYTFSPKDVEIKNNHIENNQSLKIEMPISCFDTLNYSLKRKYNSIEFSSQCSKSDYQNKIKSNKNDNTDLKIDKFEGFKDLPLFDQLQKCNSFSSYENKRKYFNTKLTSLNSANQKYNKILYLGENDLEDNVDHDSIDGINDNNFRILTKKPEMDENILFHCSAKHPRVFSNEFLERNANVFDDKLKKRYSFFKLPTAEVKRPPGRLKSDNVKSQHKMNQHCSNSISSSSNNSTYKNPDSNVIKKNLIEERDDVISLFTETNMCQDNILDQLADNEVEIDVENHKVFFADHVSEDIFAKSRTKLDSSLDCVNVKEAVHSYQHSSEVVDRELTLSSKKSYHQNGIESFLHNEQLFPERTETQQISRLNNDDNDILINKNFSEVCFEDVNLEEIPNLLSPMTNDAKSQMSIPLVEQTSRIESTLKNIDFDKCDINSCMKQSSNVQDAICSFDVFNSKLCPGYKNSLKIQSNGLEKHCSNNFIKSLMFICSHFLKFGSCRLKDTCMYMHQLPLDLESILRALSHDDLLNSYNTIIRNNKFLFKNTFPWVVKCFSEFNDRDQLFHIAKEVKEINIDGDKLIYLNCIVDALSDTFMEVPGIIDKLFELFGNSDLSMVDILFELILREGYFENNWSLIKKLSSVQDYKIDIQHIELILKDCCEKAKPRKYYIYNVYYDIILKVDNVNIQKISIDVMKKFMGLLKYIGLNEELISLQSKLHDKVPQCSDGTVNVDSTQSNNSSLTDLKNTSDCDIPSKDNLFNVHSLRDFNSKSNSIPVSPSMPKILDLSNAINCNNQLISLSKENNYIDKNNRNVTTNDNVEYNSFSPFFKSPTKKNCVMDQLNNNNLMQNIEKLYNALVDGKMNTISNILKDCGIMNEMTKTLILIRLSKNNINKEVIFNNLFHFSDHDSNNFKVIWDVFNRFGLYLIMSYLFQKQNVKANDIFKKMFIKSKFSFLCAKLLEFKYTVPRRCLLCCKLLMQFAKFEMAFQMLNSYGLLVHDKWNFKCVLQSDVALRNKVFYEFMDKIIKENILFAIKVFKILSSNENIAVDIYTHCNSLFRKALDNDLNKDVVELTTVLLQKKFISLLPTTLRAIFVIVSQNSNFKEIILFYNHCAFFNIFPRYIWESHQLIIYSDLHIEEIRGIFNHYFMSVKVCVKQNVEILINHRIINLPNDSLVPKVLRVVDKSIHATKQRIINVLNSLKPSVFVKNVLESKSVLILASDEINKYLLQNNLVN